MNYESDDDKYKDLNDDSNDDVHKDLTNWWFCWWV